MIAVVHAVASVGGPAPGLLWSLPFALLLLAIAAGPLISLHWWERNYPWIALPLGAAVVLGYVVLHDGGSRMLHTAHEYFSFISLIGSLFVVSGGIHIRLRGKSTPGENVRLLAIGAFIANFVGTTGAAMILLRPFIRGNRWRFKPYHLVFFIFVVANCGGALTPIGDPPLFLGYLRGVPFLWVLEHLWHKWAIALAALLVMFYVIDRRDYGRQAAEERRRAEAEDIFIFEGFRNFGFVGLIIGAAFIQAPIFLREGIMIAAAVASYFATPQKIHRENEFNFHPVREVAILFAGIFATMVPALDWLTANAGSLGITSSSQYYWFTGVLSSILDNAPTYLNFLTTAMGVEGLSSGNPAHVMQFAQEHAATLSAISIAAVFFGAATYIGNGPNFMCKAIAAHEKLQTPSFFEYIYKYSLPILLPVLLLTYLLVCML